MKDRKILYQLDLDSRQSFTQIGKKVGLKKDVVAYRVKRMQDEGIIKNFYAVIDAYKLGYTVFRFYLVFQYVTPDIKKKIIDYLVNEKHTWVVASIKGKYDLSVVLWVKDIDHFYAFWEKLLDNFGDYFAEKTFSLYIQSFAYRNSYLLIDEFKPEDREKYEIVGGGEIAKIDEIDYQILNEIAVNARMPLIDLAEKLKCSSQMVNYRLNNLMKSGVIQAFRVGVALSQLGLRHFKVDINLKTHTQRKHIMSYIKYNPNLAFIATSAGVSDLELEFNVENEEKLNQIMEELSQKFPGAIRNYSYFFVQESHKVRCIPEL